MCLFEKCKICLFIYTVLRISAVDESKGFEENSFNSDPVQLYITSKTSKIRLKGRHWVTDDKGCTERQQSLIFTQLSAASLPPVRCPVCPLVAAQPPRLHITSPPLHNVWKFLFSHCPPFYPDAFKYHVQHHPSQQQD